MLVVIDGDRRLLMQRRGPAGVWAGLWSLPQFESETEAQDWQARHLVDPSPTPLTLAPIAHAFSHYRLNLRPLRMRAVALASRVGDNPDLRWVARTSLAALGIPAPIRTLADAQLRRAEEDPAP